MLKILNLVLDILFPKKCYSCSEEGHFLCANCFDRLKIKNPYCYICKKPSNNYEIHSSCKKKNTYFDFIIVLFHYRDKSIKKLIKDSKFYSKTEILKELGFYYGLELQKLKKTKETKDIVIVSSPIHYLRRLKRGYNQSEILAKSISKSTNIEFNSKVLIKTRNTRQQSKLSKQKRELNLLDSFKINKNLRDKVDKKTIILVDDVVSTGSTMNEISRVLKNNGAKEVIGVCLASD